MADQVVAKSDSDGGEDRTIIPADQYQVVLVDVVDCGSKVETYQNGPEKLAPKVALVFQTNERDEQGRRYEISREFTNSLGKKANLRTFLESWKGSSITDDEARAGISLAKLVGHNGLASVEHKKSGKGNVYAFLKGIAPLLKSIPKIQAESYERAPFWADRKKEYAEGAAAFRAKHPTKEAATLDDVKDVFDAQVIDEDDDLPF